MTSAEIFKLYRLSYYRPINDKNYTCIIKSILMNPKWQLVMNRTVWEFKTRRELPLN